MAAVTIYSDFGAQKIKSVTVSNVSPSICHEVMGPEAMILVFWMDLPLAEPNRKAEGKTVQCSPHMSASGAESQGRWV